MQGPGRGRGRPLHGHHRLRELRQGPAGRHEQHPAAIGAVYDIAATARTSSAPAGASTPISATRTRTCCSRRPTPADPLRHRCSASTTPPASATPTAASTASASRSTNMASAERGPPAHCRCSASGSIRSSSSPTRCRPTLGWSHELTPSTVITVDYVHIDGRDLNFRPRLNQRIQRRHDRRYRRRRRSTRTRTATRAGDQPRQERVRRPDPRPGAGCRRGLDFTASYTLSRGAQHDRQRPADELNTAQHPGRDQPVRRSAAARAQPHAPTRATGSPSSAIDPAAVEPARGAVLHLSARRCRSTSIEGATSISTATLNDLPTRAFAFDSSDDDSGIVDASKDIGACETVNCGRGCASVAAEPPRVEGVPAGGARRHRGDRRDLQRVQRHQSGEHRERRSPPSSRRCARSAAQRIRPTCSRRRFSGDFQQPEQRVGQIGFRFTF